MRIALFVHCFFPAHFYGTETYTLQLAKRLREAGHDPVVVTAIFPGEPEQAEFVRRYEHEGIAVISLDKNHLPNTRVKDTFYQIEMREPLRAILKELRPDILHVTHLVNHTAVLIEVAAELGIPRVATFTDFFGFCFNNKLEGADGELCAGPDDQRLNCVACYLKASSHQPTASLPLKWAARLGANRFGATLLDRLRHTPGYRLGELDGLIEDLKQRPDMLAKCYGLYSAAIAPTRFLENAYRLNGFTRPMIRSWFGVDLDRSPKPVRGAGAPLVFGFIGQLAPHKGTDILVEAFCKLRQDKAELRIYGPFDQDPAFIARLRVLAGARNVQLLGTYQSAMAREVLDGLDLLVIPSRWYENSPLVILDALASHTPVIVSNVEGLTEFIEEGTNGFAFDRGSVASLQTALEQFVDDPSLARRMSATTNFERDTKAMADDVLALYRRYALTNDSEARVVQREQSPSEHPTDVAL